MFWLWLLRWLWLIQLVHWGPSGTIYSVIETMILYLLHEPNIEKLLFRDEYRVNVDHLPLWWSLERVELGWGFLPRKFRALS